MGEPFRGADSSLCSVKTHVNTQKINCIRTYAKDRYGDWLFGLWLLNLDKVFRIKVWFSSKSRSDSSLLSMTKYRCETTEL